MSERVGKTLPPYIDKNIHVQNQLDLLKKRRYSHDEDIRHSASLFTDQISDASAKCSLSVIPELPTISEIATPLLRDKPRQFVSFTPLLKHEPDESPVLSPEESEVEESDQARQNNPISRKKYSRRDSRYRKSAFRSVDKLVAGSANASGDLLLASAVTYDMISSPLSHQFRASESFPRRKFSKYNPVQEGSFNEFHIKPTLRKFLVGRISEIFDSASNLLVFEQGPPKILVVEDSEIARKTICEQIKYVVNAEPDIAQNGEEAVEQYISYSKQGFMYYLIFMDIIMPKLDGYQATRKIRELEKEYGNPRTYIVGLSANEHAENKCKEAGMDQFCNIYIVKKPTTIRDMERVIHSRSN